MKLFIDSSQSILALILWDDSFNLIDIKQIDTKYKVEEIIKYFDGIDNIKNIKDIYVNVGPGSFVGSRISLLYIRTMAQINNEINIYQSNTFKLLCKQSRKIIKHFYINATKQKSYYLTKSKIEIIDKQKKEILIDYNDLANNFTSYLNQFENVDIANLKPIYASEPQIGKGK